MRQAAKRAGGRWKPERPACEWTYESRRGPGPADDLPALREHAATCGMTERGRYMPQPEVATRIFSVLRNRTAVPVAGDFFDFQ
ncbi:hypothetical protein AV656_13210 [Bhargavaea cecembensis]|uniref:Uncharacterized protein n=1 Tax=Bhargavaea cecembensis TaxID=394098 RepID=A0A165GSP4_9BACL|nr:hypothetical protein AV656_13210 [Bhargavaea cecembensis]